MRYQSALYTIINEKIIQNVMVLPTLPNIAIKLQKTIDDPDVSLQSVSQVISQDPALSLSILKVANSALFGRTVKVTSLSQAVTRIGLTRIKSISIALALSQIYISKNEIVDVYLKKSWQETINVASVAIALLSFYKKTHKHSSLCLHTFTLAAMVHNVGALPILTEAEKHPDIFANPTFIKEATVELSPVIGGDIMKTWEMPKEFIGIVERWSDLTYLPDEVTYIDFLRAGALYHQMITDAEVQESLMERFIEKELIPDLDFMESEEFIEVKKSIQDMFSS